MHLLRHQFLDFLTDIGLPKSQNRFWCMYKMDYINQLMDYLTHWYICKACRNSFFHRISKSPVVVQPMTL